MSMVEVVKVETVVTSLGLPLGTRENKTQVYAPVIC